jgi:hypothetical protein
MKILRQEKEGIQPCPRGFTADIRILSFKGRKDVLAHLFRPRSQEEAPADYPWAELISADTVPDAGSRGDTREVILESFTKTELDQIVDYLAERYASRLNAITTNCLSYPLPAGLLPLRAMSAGKDMGIIRFEIVPGYPLPFPMHGFYDLSRHKPMEDEAF